MHTIYLSALTHIITSMIRLISHTYVYTYFLIRFPRYITGPFGWLVTRCKAMKTSFGQEYYGVDACMSNLMRPGMYDSYHHITIPDREGGMSILERAAAQEEGEGRAPRHVVGTLCENNDWFCKGRDLPTAQLGDLVVIHDTGTRTRSRDSRCAGDARRRAGGSHRQARAGMMKA